MASRLGSPNKDKPYREALRMELAAAGPDLKALRKIAQRHIKLAEQGDMQAIKELADRLDGKPAQESTVSIEHRNATELSDNELADIATRGGEDAADAAPDPSKLN